MTRPLKQNWPSGDEGPKESIWVRLAFLAIVLGVLAFWGFIIYHAHQFFTG